MVRLKGTRNADYHTRRELLLACLKRELKTGGPRPTLRDLAKGCDRSVSTLKHYFGRRDDIVQAVFEDSHRRAAAHLADVGQTELPFAESVRSVAREAWMVLNDLGAARTLVMGLIEGLGSPRLGASYLKDMFDPFIRALREGHVRQAGVNSRMA